MPGTDGIDLVRAVRRRPATSTLPFILTTGVIGEADAVEALTAGADDFLPKTIRFEELIARVRAHLRTQAAWTEIVVAELRTRASAIEAIGQLSLSHVPQEAARSVVSELALRIGSQFVGVFRLGDDARLEPVARWDTVHGLLLGGPAVGPARSQSLVDRARGGPWVERPTGPEPGEPSDGFWDVRADLAAGAPIHAGDDLVGLLVIAVAIDSPTTSVPMLRARLLASVTDYASVLGASVGAAIAGGRRSTRDRADLRGVLTGRRFFPVYQPIVSLRTGLVVGYEALTRFIDGAPPDKRFAEAAAAGLGFEFELATIDAAVTGAPPIGADQFLSVNVSPDLVVMAGKRLKRALAASRGRIVLEVTEHAPIANYEAFRYAVGRLGKAEIAIDDAGAGYASLRHILELEPAWVKLDITLVRAIDTDPLRQALAAGLAHFAGRTGERLIAEGVERREEADVLLGIGVEFAQGYLFGAPERRKP
jgi:EAL domain-containing protein (putative c-di-GMP-specific phosphodiesterase class I)/CheY-like chemotaxis protein